MAAQAQLFAQALPEGFAYRDDLITAAEETALVARFASLSFKPFEFHGYLGNRRIVSYGWRYDYAGRALRESEAMPDFLLPLRRQAGALAGLAPEKFQQALVTEYAPGAGIGWHRDKPMFEDVVGFSFLSPCILRFRRKQDDKWQRLSQPVCPVRAICCADRQGGTGSTAFPPSKCYAIP
jgi:alkylated DNA repair dioxygenase AlkB